MWKAMNVFIDQMRRLYNDWDIKVMVLLTLLFQVILQLLGNRRKFSRSVWLRIIVWCCYVSVDSIAIMALGTISTKIGRVNDLSHLDGETKLNVLWAPCLLLLLGGPDSITAYSVEDNQLWLRHFAVLVAQTSVACYVCFMAWVADCLSYLSLLLLVAGVIKYGERVWVLWQVSFDKMRNAEYLNFDEISRELNLNNYRELHNEPTHGFTVFQIFKRVFLGQKLYMEERDISNDIFTRLSPQQAFKIIEIELGFMYDLLHTKAKSTYTWWGLCRRLMTSAISCVVLTVFSWFVNNTVLYYPRIDVAVTLVLLATNISSEIYWAFMLLMSDWAQVVWFSRKEESCCSKMRFQLYKLPGWTNSTGQLSFFSLFFDDLDDERPLYCSRLLKRLHLHEKVGPYYYAQHQDITNYIKDHIFMTIKKIGNKELFTNHQELLLHCATTEQCTRTYSELADYEFEDTIIIWHIATELCYYFYKDKQEAPSSDEADRKKSAAMMLSRYMFYILVRYPLMLQTVDVSIKLKDIRDEYFQELKIVRKELRRHNKLTKSYVVDKLMTAMTYKRAFSYASSYAAGGLAKRLTNDGENTWGIILNSWVAHLVYAAYNCREEYHTQHLRRGGELLTHVWMLMLHFGLSNHFTHSSPPRVILGS